MTAQEYITNYMPDFDGNSTVLQTAINAAQAQAETYIGRPLASATYEEEYAGAPRILLEKWPVTAVTYVKDADGEAITDYRIDMPRGIIWLKKPQKTVTVKYTAGYATVPADISMAIALTVQIMLRTLDSGGQLVEQERLGDWSASYAVPDKGGALCPAAMALLEPYKARRL